MKNIPKRCSKRILNEKRKIDKRYILDQNKIRPKRRILYERYIIIPKMDKSFCMTQYELPIGLYVRQRVDGKIYQKKKMGNETRI